jgi:hypothetical protein
VSSAASRSTGFLFLHVFQAFCTSKKAFYTCIPVNDFLVVFSTAILGFHSLWHLFLVPKSEEQLELQEIAVESTVG